MWRTLDILQHEGQFPAPSANDRLGEAHLKATSLDEKSEPGDNDLLKVTHTVGQRQS